MATASPGFLIAHPRLAKAIVLGLLVLALALAAFLGLQLHFPAQTFRESVMEWTAFLASLGACLAILLAGARLLDRRVPQGPDPVEDGPGTPLA